MLKLAPAILLDRGVAPLQRRSGPAVLRGLLEPVALIWPFLLLAAFACFTVAPVVNSDSTVLTSYLLWGAVPHFPPLYPIFTRVMSVLASVLGWIAGGSAPHLGIVDPAPFARGAATLTLLAQHVLTLASAAYLANRLRPDRHGRSDQFGRYLLIAALYLNPFTLRIVHAVQSEALVIPAAYAAAAEALVILTRPRRPLRHYAAFLAWVLLAALARHPAIVLGALLPIGFVLKATAALARRNWPGLRAALAALALVCTGVAAVQAADMLLNRVVILSMGMEPFSAPGRAFTYRLAKEFAGTRLLPNLDAGRLERVVEHLVATAESAELKRDIAIVANTPGAWVGPYNKILEEVQRACRNCGGGRIMAETDRRLNRVMIHAVFSSSPDLIRDVLMRSAAFLAPYAMFDAMWDGRLSTGFMANVKFDPVSGFLWKGHDFEFAMSDAANLLREFLFSIACGVVLLSLLSSNRRRFASLSLGLIATAAVYSFLVSVVTVYIPRYGLFVDQLALIAVVVALAAASGGSLHEEACGA